MMSPVNRLIIPLGEGQGEEKSLPTLMRRLAPQGDVELNVQICTAWRVGHLQGLLKDDGKKWKSTLNFARQKGAAGVLLLLDGDRPSGLGRPPLCAGTVAGNLVSLARSCGAGRIFSLAVVIARQEMESWFIAGAESLKAGDRTGQPLVMRSAAVPATNLEEAPRDAKGWLAGNMHHGYKPAVDQQRLAACVDLGQVREREMRSFRRFEKAVSELFRAVTTGDHIATPSD
jgi:hypothetical protein